MSVITTRYNNTLLINDVKRVLSWDDPCKPLSRDEIIAKAKQKAYKKIREERRYASFSIANAK